MKKANSAENLPQQPPHRGQYVKPELKEGHHGEGKTIEHKKTGYEHDDQEKRHHPSQELVRDHLKREEPVPKRIEQIRVGRDRAQALGYDPLLPRELPSERSGTLLHGYGPRFVFHLVTSLADRHGEHEIVDQVRIQRNEQLPSYAVDGSVGAEDGVQSALHPLQESLIAPVVDLALHPGGTSRILVMQLAGYPSHPFIPKPWHEALQRVGPVHAVRVREDQDLPRGMRDRGVQRGSLSPAPGKPVQHDPLFPPRGHDVIGAIRGRIGSDDDLELLLGVVQLKRIVQLRADHLLLVVRGDDQRYRGQRPKRGRPPLALSKGQDPAQERISKIAVHDQREGAEE